MKIKGFHIVILTSLIGLNLSGCNSKKIEKYRVKKEKKSFKQAMLPPASNDFSFSTPKEWKTKPVEGMRKAAFSAESPDGKAEMSIISLPGAAGGLVQNINRWRGQLNLNPSEEEQILKEMKPLQVDGHPGQKITIFSKDQSQAMSAVLVNVTGQTWFFKFKGDAALIKSQDKIFDQFMQSFKFSKTTSPAMPKMAIDTPPTQTLAYQMPPGWEEQKASGMRVASFTAGQNDKSVEISVIPLRGEAGGILDNVNRWRRQVELSPEEENKIQNQLKEIEVGGEKGFQIQLINQGKDHGMTVALVKKNEETWFFKMSGPVQGVQSQEKAFDAFIQSIKFVSNQPQSEKSDPLSSPPAKKSGTSFTYNTPSDWVKQSSSGMRKASFKIGTADVSVISLPGDAGGTVSNVNRWRGQVGLDSLNNTQVQKFITPITIDKNEGFKVELIAPDQQSAILVAMTTIEGNSWFFKLKGSPEVIKDQRQNFDDFLKSVQFRGAQ